MPGHRSRGPKRPAQARPDEETDSAALMAPTRSTYRIGPGKPTSLNQNIIDAVAELVSLGLSIPIAVKALGIPRKTSDDWTAYGKRDLARGVDSIYAQWWSALEEGKAACEVTLLKRIVDASLYDWRAAQFVLQSRYPERYLPPDKQPNKLGDDLSTKSTEELKQMLADVAAGKMPKLKAGAADLAEDASEELEETPAVIDVENTGS